MIFQHDGALYKQNQHRFILSKLRYESCLASWHARAVHHLPTTLMSHHLWGDALYSPNLKTDAKSPHLTRSSMSE